MVREKLKWEDPIRVRVPMRGTGADQLVVVLKSPNGDGAKGLDHLALLFGQPVMGRAKGKRGWLLKGLY